LNARFIFLVEVNFTDYTKLPVWVEDKFIDEIKCWENNGCIILVKNQGPNIPEEEQQKIFEPFHQADDARNKTYNCAAGL